QRLPDALGVFLQHHHRRDETPSHAGGDRFAQGIWESTRREREDNTSRHYYQVEPGVAAERALHVLPQVARTDQYFASSSRIRPVPRTTQVSGSSSTCIGSPVACDSRPSGPRVRAPPPAITVPRATL